MHFGEIDENDYQRQKTIYVNNTDNAIIFRSGQAKAELESILAELLDPEVRRRIDASNTERTQAVAINRQAELMQVLIEENRRGKILLSSAHFTAVDARFTNVVSKQIVEATRLGRGLVRDLRKPGLYDFIQKVSTTQNQSSLQRIMTRLLASLSMSVVGVSSIDDISSDVFTAWLKFHRHPSVARWRPELWNSGRDFSYQCLRELTRAFSRHLGDDSFLQLSTQARSDSLTIKSTIFAVTSPPNEFKAWHEVFDLWLEEFEGQVKRYDQMFSFLLRWLESLKGAAPIYDPKAFLLTDRHTSFKEFLLEQRENGRTDKDRQSNAYPHHLRNARSLTNFIVEMFDIRVRVYPLASDREIRQADNEVLLSSAGITERGARPLPEPLYRLTREILEEGEAGWPGSMGMCNHEVYQDGKLTNIYCPVLPTLYLMLFEIPPRVGQAKRLDSGEGDTRRFNATTMSWETNIGPHAGYWSQRSKTSERGYARIVSDDPPITGIFINTNKTGRPHTIDWQCEWLHQLLYNLLVWQETYNPISGPIRPIRYVDGVRAKDEEGQREAANHLPAFPTPGNKSQRCEMSNSERQGDQ